MNKLLLFFILINIINVILSTFRSLTTINSGKWTASIIAAITYGFYTVVIVYTVCELPLWQKVVIVALANLFGTYVSKLIFDKIQKEKLWKVEVTIPTSEFDNMIKDCEKYDFTYNYINVKKYMLFNFYCSTKKDSNDVKKLLESYDAKYFVSESQNL